MSTEENKAIVRRFWEEVNRGNLDVVDELVSPDYVQYLPYLTNAFGSQGLKAMLRQTHTSLTEWKSTILDLLADGDRVILRAVNEATHSGDLDLPWGGSVPPTGKRLRQIQIIIYQVVEGKIVADWGVTDNLESLHELGLLRSPA
jgi:predicted ester cyclase